MTEWKIIASSKPCVLSHFSIDVLQTLQQKEEPLQDAEEKIKPFLEQLTDSNGTSSAVNQRGILTIK